MGFYQHFYEQKLAVSRGELWDFVSQPANLKMITPQHMGFKILTRELPNRMYAGMLIQYRVYPIPYIPTKWLTEITHVDEPNLFVDEQRSGPYLMWHHQHWLYEIEGGTLMCDIVSYIPPMGVIGDLAQKIFIGPKVDSIFEYRRVRLDQLFGTIE